jgi:HPt (histidine-containing phosphotransfer) domain-containing protein
MTSPSDPVLELKELQEYFAGRLPERLAEMDDAWSAVTASGWEEERVRTLHRLAHSLTGAGSTFGYPEVSRTARILERFLKAALDGSGPAGEGAANQVARLLEGVQRAAQWPPIPPAPLPIRPEADPSPCSSATTATACASSTAGPTTSRPRWSGNARTC